MNARQPTAQTRVRGILRVACYALVVSFAGGLVGARAVYAAFEEGSLRVGRELDGLSDVLGDANTVFINGAAMNISTAFTTDTPGEVLDRFEAICRSHPQFMVRALSDVKTALLEKVHVHPDQGWRLGVMRKEEGDDGVLTCFTDERQTAFGDLAARFKAFEKSQDLAEFGRFRYVYVRRTDRGTHVRTVWADGEVNLGKMFPPHGDAAGFDSPLMPRPPAATRILSATSLQVPFGVHVYESSEREDELHRFYDKELGARGMKAVADRNENTQAYVRSGAMFFVTFAHDGAHTLVTTTESARADTPMGTEVHLQR